MANAKHRCPRCGAPLPLDAPAGNCPQCLLRLTLSVPKTDPLPAQISPRSQKVDSTRDPAAPAGDSLLPPGSVQSIPPGSALNRSFGDYELLEEAGRGGMGVVFRARQRSLNRIVAVKMLLFGKFSSADFLRRFRAEAELAASLHHPNIVTIHEIGEHEGQPYFTMDFVEGRSLAELVREKPLPARQAARCLQIIAEAVHYAHEHGVLHRDLKPTNILIDEANQPRITDFGLAKRLVAQAALPAVSPTAKRPSGGQPAALEANAGFANPQPPTQQTGSLCNELTLPGETIGSPNYIPPEQAGARRGQIGPRSDIYALGAVLYHLLTGRPPFLAETLEETLVQVLDHEPAPPHLLNPAVPRDLETICLKCLEKEAARRYGSAAELAAELNRFLSDEPIQACPTGPISRLWRWSRRKSALAASLASVLLLLVVLVLGSIAAAIRIDAARREESFERSKALSANRQLENANARLSDTINQLEFQRAEDLFAAGDDSSALAYLAGMLRGSPSNHVAAERLLSALLYRDFALPTGPPLRHSEKVVDVQFGRDGRWVLSASEDGTAQVWESQTGQRLGAPMRHNLHVWSARFSPDGQQVVTASGDKTARIWKAATGEPLTAALAHDAPVWMASFSPEGDRVVTASWNGTARIWDTSTGKLRHELRGHSGQIRSAEFSPNGRQIVTASLDGTARLWDALTGVQEGKSLEHGGAVRSACFSPEGTRIVTGSADARARVWDARSLALIGDPMRHDGGVTTVEWSPDGQRVVTASDDRAVRIWDASTGRPLTPPIRHTDVLYGAHFSPDGERIVTMCMDYTARLWDAHAGTPLSQPMRHLAAVSKAAFSPGGRSLVTASHDGSLQTWDVLPGQAQAVLLMHSRPGELQSAGGFPEASPSVDDQATRASLHRLLPFSGFLESAVHPQRIHHAEFSPDGARVVTASLDDTAQVWDARTGEQIGARLEHRGDVLMASFSPDGRKIVTASQDRAVRVWDASTGQPLTPPMHHAADVWHAAFSPDGARVASASMDRTIRLWDALSGAALHVIAAHDDMVFSVQFSPEGKYVVSASLDKTARVWDASTGQPVTPKLQHLDRVLDACFSPDGRRVLTASADDTAIVWDARTGERLLPPLTHARWVESAVFSPNGRWIVTASWDSSARIWDGRTGTMQSQLPHGHRVWSARFSPDSQRVVTASWDRTARVWDVQTGQPLTEPLRHDQLVWDAQFSPDGQRVVTVSSDRTARVWAIPRAGERVPDWLPTLADAVAGFRFTAQRTLQPVRLEDLEALRSRLNRSTETDDCTRVAQWFFADRTLRPTAPGSPVTMPEFLSRDRVSTDATRLREVLQFEPTNGVVLARLVRLRLSPGTVANVPALREAEWRSRRATLLAPGSPEVWTTRVETLQRLADCTKEAELTNCLRSGIEATTHLIELLADDTDNDAATRRAVFLQRAKLQKRLGQFAQAAADNMIAIGIPARDPRASPDQIDLSLHYNAALRDTWHSAGEENSLISLSPGLLTLGGAQFDVRGLVQLAWAGTTDGRFPDMVRGIHLGRRCQRLHFLHASIFGTVTDTNRIGSYIIRYRDGSTAILPLVFSENIRDWWSSATPNAEKLKPRPLWKSSNTASRRFDCSIGLFDAVWENPRPDEFIESLDFTSAGTPSAPFLVAVTAEP